MKILGIAASGMQTTAVSSQVTANNIANVNTNQFRHSRVRQETGPNGQGVRVGSIDKSTISGPRIPGAGGGSVEGSNTDIAREMVQLTVNEHSYTANAKVVQTADEMAGTLLNMIS